MPRIRRWFNVSHDINSDEEVWELTDKWDAWGLRVWLQMLSIADRNDGIVKGDIELNERWMSRLFSSNSRRYSTKWRREMCHSLLEWMQNKRWIEIRLDAIVIVNWLIYNPTRETKGAVKQSPPTSPPTSPPNLPNLKTPIVPKGTSKRSASKSRMSPDFQVTDEHRRYATEHNFRSPDILFEAFKDHHAKNGSAFADWDAAFRTWIRNDTERFGANRRQESQEQEIPGMSIWNRNKA